MKSFTVLKFYSNYIPLHLESMNKENVYAFKRVKRKIQHNTRITVLQDIFIHVYMHVYSYMYVEKFTS